MKKQFIVNACLIKNPVVVFIRYIDGVNKEDAEINFYKLYRNSKITDIKEI